MINQYIAFDETTGGIHLVKRAHAEILLLNLSQVATKYNDLLSLLSLL